MDLLSKATFDRLEKEEEKLLNFHEFNQSLQILSTGDVSASSQMLYQTKNLFQKMLPKMPREYIIRQVYDNKHYNVLLTQKIHKKSGEITNITGAVCYRPFFERNFVEIVFFAIDSEFHIKGYGTFLFSCLKQIIKMQFSKYLDDEKMVFKDEIIENLDKIINLEYSSKYNDAIPLYLLTYADNSAIGFFKKQGFGKEPLSKNWVHYVKDYDGGTLMECKLHKPINYLKKKKLFEEIRNKIFDKMKEVNDYHIKRTEKDRKLIAPLIEEYRNEIMTKAHSHPKRRNISTDKDTYKKAPQAFLFDFIFYLLCELQSHPSAWPFLQPVSAKEVPDYYHVISHPIDLDTMSKKHKNGHYKLLKEFSDDVFLMTKNCFIYNGRDTQYFKCAEIIKKHYLDVLKRHEPVITKWGFF